ncbi:MULTISPECIES: HEPN domain-containing protein [Rhodococcus]|nr:MULTISPECIES: HEPN domain-containing protein [Rhodococcus]
MENDPNAEAVSDEHSAQFDTIVISNMFEIFVAPEVRRRGLSIAPRSVDQFLAELPSGDRSVEVRLGDEARMAVTLAKAEDGLQYLDRIEPMEGEVHSDSGWVCYFRAENGAGILGFDFRRNLEQARKLLTKAEGFLAVAVSSGNDTLSPAIDLLYSSAELTVQALMLLQSDTNQSHKHRREWLRRWTAAQNSPADHAQVLDNLASLRAPARYEPNEPKLKPGRFQRIVSTVQEMIDVAHGYAGNRSPSVNVEIAPDFMRHESRNGSHSIAPKVLDS